MEKYRVGLMRPSYDNVLIGYRKFAKSVVASILEDPYEGHRVFDHITNNRYSLSRTSNETVLLIGYAFDFPSLVVEFPFVGSFKFDQDIDYFRLHLSVRKLLQTVSQKIGLELL
jgi:hypothetical protein